MITVTEIHSKKDLRQFVKFPFQLYKDSKYWVPPIINQELQTFNKKKNPIFQDAEARFFLAYKNNRIVGRIAAIINWLEVDGQNQKKMRFGWFDFIDDLEVSKALLQKVEHIGKENNLEYTEGPVGFSNLDKVGVVTEGFDAIAPMVTWYNHPYYVKHYESFGYKAEKMFDLFNESYASLSSFVKITDIQKEYFKKKFISFINPEYIKFVVDKNDELVGFAIVMPAFSKALQKANGKLFPFGFRHILDAKRNSKDAIFYLIGIHPDYQNKGVHAVLFNEYYETFTEKGIKTCFRTPELEDNEAIQKIWKHFDPVIFRRRKTFRKNLN